MLHDMIVLLIEASDYIIFLMLLLGPILWSISSYRLLATVITAVRP